jgi:AGZA family xanthine/uracil permease-like MFS transporter
VEVDFYLRMQLFIFDILLVSYGPLPIAFVALATGTALGWATSLNTGSAVRGAVHLIKGYPPVFPIKQMFLHIDTIQLYLSTTIPTAIAIAIGTIQCVESAKRAGDFYPTRESMFVDGIGTLISTFFGSILSMTGKFLQKKEFFKLILNHIAYIGQPAMKKMGAKQAYSVMHGLSYLPLCFLGFSGVLISIIAVVAINPIVVRILISKIFIN